MCSWTAVGCFGEENIASPYRDIKFGSSNCTTLLTMPSALLPLLIRYGMTDKSEHVNIEKVK
jgi:hypothetical protein